MIRSERGALLYRDGQELVRIEPWGENALRVRASVAVALPEHDWALLPPVETAAQITASPEGGELVNGAITCRVTAAGKLSFFRTGGGLLLEEFVRSNRVVTEDFASSLHVAAREYKAAGGLWKLTARFESDPKEKLYGMGQYQQPYLNLKGCRLELAQRNSQASVPFLVSSLGYGLLWHNPAVGEVTFGKNLTQWQAALTDGLDYWITAGDTPARIVAQYAAVTGTVPRMPEYGLGFWQCKLRYSTQEELLEVAREYHRRGVKLDVIVVDFFHWTCQGDWKFDTRYWPDPTAMVRELEAMGIRLMVSVWPTVDQHSENYPEMRELGLLTGVERGADIAGTFMGNCSFADMTNPETRSYVWAQIREHYVSHGIRLFWLDLAEPEYDRYDFENYRYHLGPVEQVGNVYPQLYARAFSDGLTAQGETAPLSLLRCAWAGSQRYGALVWSGDIHSGFRSMRCQLAAGLNMAMAGIPWWTTDIGGFHGGNGDDPRFREVLARWFAWGAYCPVMRLHGDRLPSHPGPDPLVPGGGQLQSGAANEIWSFGDELCGIFTHYIAVRESLRPYLRALMEEAHNTGAPVMRPLFYEFPEDPAAWDVEDAYLLGSRYLVAPVMQAGVTARPVYLPAGAVWTEEATGIRYSGGQTVSAYAPLEVIPVFLREV